MDIMDTKNKHKIDNPESRKGKLTDTTVSMIDIELELDPRINFAVQQNAVSVIKLLRLTNKSDSTLTNLTVTIQLEPDYAPVWEAHIDSITPETSFTVDKVYLELSPQKLATLEERLAGKLHLYIKSGTETIQTLSKTIEFLAFNEWSGVASPPELLAAFVQPNHPAISKIMKNARQHLESLSGSPAFSGYQENDPQHVYNMSKAIYQAIQSHGITYINPPASFEIEGQKIRTPDRIMEDQMGTCLDLSVLMAAGLENVGLNPFIVTIPGHAFAGVWLSETSLPVPAFDDFLQLRKYSELNMLLVFDSSTMAAKPRISFEQAVRQARELLIANENIVTIDIKASRDHRIRPLPMRTDGELRMATADTSQLSTKEDIIKLNSISLDRLDEEEPTESASDRLDRWKNKLLDMSLRNRLLNFKETKNGTLELISKDLPKLEDAFSDGKPFTLMTKPTVMDGENDPRNAELHKQQTGEDARAVFLGNQLEKHRIYTPYEDTELKRRATELHRKARLSLEESGTNTLYLALGFVYWRDSNKNSEPHKAPILLLPVTLSRKKVTDPFRIILADSEPRINTTFLKKLENEFGINDPRLFDLPEDDAGLDLPLIFNRYREAVLNLHGWEVKEEAHVGIFSFTKYLMWLDLEERTEELKENQVVKHLLERVNKAYEGKSGFLSAADLESKLDQKKNYCVLDADSSQLAGVYAADHGQSFVMEGPPGTGKSQTITNMISQMMAQGKSVLFVSEKRAALEVVYRRLKNVGLKEFCLELHSNKSNSKEIIRQLGESLDARYTSTGNNWEQNTRQLTERKEQLNTYIKAAYEPRTFGKSFHDAVVKLIGLADCPKVNMNLKDGVDINSDRYLSLSDSVRDYYVAAKVLKAEPINNPWNSVRLDKWNPATSDQLLGNINSLGKNVKKLAQSEQYARKLFHLPAKRGSKEELERLDTLCQMVNEAPGHSADLLGVPEWTNTKKELTDLTTHGLKFHSMREDIKEHFDFDVMHKLDLDNLIPKFRRWQTSFFLLAWFMLFFARSAVRKASVDGKLASNTEILADLEACKTAIKEETWLENHQESANKLFGAIWNNLDTDWKSIYELSKWTENLRSELDWWEITCPQETTIRRNKVIELCGERHANFIKNGKIGENLDVYRKCWSGFKENYAKLCSGFELDEQTAFSKTDAPAYLPTVWNRLKQWSADKSHLESWVRFLEADHKLKNAGLSVFSTAFQNGNFQTSEIEKTYKHSFYEWWIQELYKSEQILADFYSPTYEETIHQFRTFDEKSFALAREITKAQLVKKLPSTKNNQNPPPSSEMGILRRELNKQRRHKKIRPLLEELPTLLPTLKPCFLMSPLSVAQYLGSKIPKFDLVIFDEASQIPPWDAIGAIGRGKKVIVVGDSKQMPPTNFFQTGNSDEDFDVDDSMTEDMESILSECVASDLPRHWLSWHYRSRHEHLIAFSNHHYYQNRLLTFPSSVESSPRLGVKWIHVKEGYFDRGKSRTNKGEAEQVVNEIVKRLQNPDERGRSIGVVTFSQAQQKLVEDLLEQKRAEFPEIEPYFSEDLQEPVFVKNLENVQGDERDVIIFSICYGPDSVGKVYMNFGPLNKKGGERRLNVAITRAREQLVVFSSLTPEMIDLSRTRAEGAEHLKTFLAYADRGPSVIAQATNTGSQGDFDSPFEEAVFQILTDLGWTVHSQVGCSGYRIDLGVTDPKAPGDYLLGIECDGATYHSSKNARDRDRIRQSVLENLGWTIHRIWSTDWWKDKKGEIEKIQNVLKNIIQSKTDHTIPKTIPDKMLTDQILSTKEDRVDIPQKYASMSSAVKEPTIYEQNNDDNNESALLPNQQIYFKHLLPEQKTDFYDAKNTNLIGNKVLQVVSIEAPLHKEALVAEIRKAWGYKKAGTTIHNRVLTCIEAISASQRPILIDDFYWRNKLEPAAYKFFRTPKENAPDPRQIKEIPAKEISNAANELVKQYGKMNEEDLMRETAKLFGINRLTRNVKSVIAKSLGGVANSDL